MQSLTPILGAPVRRSGERGPRYLRANQGPRDVAVMGLVQPTCLLALFLEVCPQRFPSDLDFPVYPTSGPVLWGVGMGEWILLCAFYFQSFLFTDTAFLSPSSTSSPVRADVWIHVNTRKAETGSGFPDGPKSLHPGSNHAISFSLL